MKPEITRFHATELRAIGGDQNTPPMLTGYGAKFGSWSRDLGGFKERIKQGAFTRALAEGADVRFLKNHNPDYVFGRTKSRTLKLAQDETGLRFEVLLPQSQAAKELHETVQRGDMDQCSFAFTVPEGGDSWFEEQDEEGRYFAARELRNVDLFDVSAVTYPAYEDTSVSARDASSIVPVELRSAIDAKNAARVKPPVEQRDDEEVDPVESDDWDGDEVISELDSDPVKKAKEQYKASKDAAKDAYKQAKDAAKAMKDEGKEKAKALKDSAKAAYAASKDAAKQALKTVKEADAAARSVGATDEFLRIYGSTKDVPDNVPTDKKPQWKEVWNSSYTKAKAEGKEDKDAEASAFAQANGVTGVKEKNSTDPESDPFMDGAGDADDPDVGDAEDMELDSAIPKTEKRDEDSLEHTISEISKALSKAFPGPTNNVAAMYPGGKYWLVETYTDPNGIVVVECETGNYFRIPYTHDESKPEASEITFGTPEPIEQEWVPATERGQKLAAQAAVDRTLLVHALMQRQFLLEDRYSDDQPRDDKGRFSGSGAGGGETASSANEHAAAAKAHMNAADKADAKNDQTSAHAHFQAAVAHLSAAGVHTNSGASQNAKDQASGKAQAASKAANKS